MEIETGCPYYIYTPDLSDYVAFNVPTDPNFVGYITDVSGLDDSGVRENAQVRTAGDYGYHGPFWRDRRPWTLSGIIIPTTPVQARSLSQRRINFILGQALRSDGYLKWLLSDGVMRYLLFRKQQPFRISRGQSNVEKTFQVAGVSADGRILQDGAVSTQIANQGNGWSVHCVNNGDTDAAVSLHVQGPVTGPIRMLNVTTNKRITWNGALTSVNSVTFDNTGVYPYAIEDGATDVIGEVDPLHTDWTMALAPGDNQITLNDLGLGSSALTTLTISWRNSWQ